MALVGTVEDGISNTTPTSPTDCIVPESDGNNTNILSALDGDKDESAVKSNDGNEKPEDNNNHCVDVSSDVEDSPSAKGVEGAANVGEVAPPMPIRYSREELLKLRNAPLTLKCSSSIENLINPRCLARVIKMRNGGGGGEDHAPSNRKQRGGGDPRDRLRKENDGGGIVLGPQRRSFNSGCFVPATATPSVPTKGNITTPSTSPAQSPINGGTGGGGSTTGGGGKQQQSTVTPSNTNRRIGSGRILRDTPPWGGTTIVDYEKSKSTKRFVDSRYSSSSTTPSSHMSTPEWYSCGPQSNSEMIDLHGFEESGEGTATVAVVDVEPKLAPSPAKEVGVSSGGEKKKQDGTESVSTTAPPSTTQHQLSNSFTFDYILDTPTMSKLQKYAPNIQYGEEPTSLTKSRFSKWFHPEQDEYKNSPTLASIENDLVKYVLYDSCNNSPANNNNNSSVLLSPSGGRLLNLADVEAKICAQSALPTCAANNTNCNDGDLTPFKRLLAQVSDGHVIPANSSPMTLMEMLSHSQQQDEMARGDPTKAPSMVRHHHHNQMRSFISNDAYAQQHEQKTSGRSPTTTNASILSDLTLQQSKELLNRPEAQAILRGMHQGDITSQHLHQQLANPALQPRHRDMLVAILNTHALMHQRVPSPRELQVHTQSILQRALLKKRFEEQQKKDRAQHHNGGATLAFTPTSVLRKMTADRDDTLVGGRPIKQLQWSSSSPTTSPITTTTTVTNTTTNNNNNGGGGRPIVKTIISTAQQDPHPQKQRVWEVFQQQEQLRRHHQQQQFSTGSGGGPTVHQQQLTLQQLRAQHQRPTSVKPSVPPVAVATTPPPLVTVEDGSSVSNNQLTRWFSPDLLEKARDGHLPAIPRNVPQHSIVNLEEIERKASLPPPPSAALHPSSFTINN